MDAGSAKCYYANILKATNTLLHTRMTMPSPVRYPELIPIASRRALFRLLGDIGAHNTIYDIRYGYWMSHVPIDSQGADSAIQTLRSALFLEAADVLRLENLSDSQSARDMPPWFAAILFTFARKVGDVLGRTIEPEDIANLALRFMRRHSGSHEVWPSGPLVALVNLHDFPLYRKGYAFQVVQEITNELLEEAGHAFSGEAIKRWLDEQAPRFKSMDRAETRWLSIWASATINGLISQDELINKMEVCGFSAFDFDAVSRLEGLLENKDNTDKTIYRDAIAFLRSQYRFSTQIALQKFYNRSLHESEPWQFSEQAIFASLTSALVIDPAKHDLLLKYVTNQLGVNNVRDAADVVLLTSQNQVAMNVLRKRFVIGSGFPKLLWALKAVADQSGGKPKPKKKLAEAIEVLVRAWQQDVNPEYLSMADVAEIFKAKIGLFSSFKMPSLESIVDEHLALAQANITGRHALALYVVRNAVATASSLSAPEAIESFSEMLIEVASSNINEMPTNALYNSQAVDGTYA